jgi:hypothetical protein
VQRPAADREGLAAALAELLREMERRFWLEVERIPVRPTDAVPARLPPAFLQTPSPRLGAIGALAVRAGDVTSPRRDGRGEQVDETIDGVGRVLDD